MGGIPGQEHPAAPERLGRRGHGSPALDALDFYGQVRVAAERGTHQVDASLDGDVRTHVGVARAIGLKGREHREEPRVAGDRESEEARQPRVVDVHDAEIAAAHKGFDVGLEVDRDAVGEGPASAHGNAEMVANGAVRAVGGHEVVGTDDLLGTTAVGADHRDAPVLALLE